MFFVAAALVLVTAGVFAGKARFVTYQLQAENGGVYTALTTSFVPTANLSIVTTGTPLSFKSTIHPTVTYNLYAISGTTEYIVQSAF